MPEGLLATARWITEYYGAPLGLTLKCMLPGGLWGESQVIATRAGGKWSIGGFAGEILDWLEGRGGEAQAATVARALGRPVWDALQRLAAVGAVELRVEPPDTAGSSATERVVAIVGDPPTLIERASFFKRRARRRELYEALESLGGNAQVRHVVDQLGFGEAVIRGLVRQGLARFSTTERVRDPFSDVPGTAPPETLTQPQAIALEAIESLPPGEGALLFGVTGSGKTLVYLEAVKRALARGKGAIVLVPEIGLTPQAVSRLRGAFGDEVAVLHSGLSDGERADAWRLLRRGERRVAVGARSAVFAPVQDLGIIVVDEEHEASYKNGETPRYLTRDVAAVRARIEGASLVLGSATPSLETMARAGDRLRLLRLPERIGARPHAAGGDRGSSRRAEGRGHRLARLVRGAGRGDRRDASRAGSRRSSCSTAGATRRSSSAPTAARSGSARDAPSRSRCIAPRPRFAVTTAATRRRCRTPAGPAPTRCSRCGASGPSSWSRSWPSGTRGHGSRGWTSTPPAPSGRTSGSSARWSEARWIS